MEKGKAYYKALVHILCCIIIILIFVLTTMKVNAASFYSKYYNKNLLKNSAEPLISDMNIMETNNLKYDSPRIIENNIHIFLNKYEKTISFFSKMFGFQEDFVKEDLLSRSMDVLTLDENNIGCLKNKNGELKTFSNAEYGISEYFFELSTIYPEKINKNIIPYSGESDYIEKLIIYYTNIYESVDTTLALSIGAAESGYYKVKYMLKKNNVFGGMGSNGLIVYNNIEIGVLKYIRLLANGYFNKGLDTPEKIGRKYCPEINSNGEKVASSHWLNLVSKANDKYKTYTKNITIEDIIEY